MFVYICTMKKRKQNEKYVHLLCQETSLYTERKRENHVIHEFSAIILWARNVKCVIPLQQ